MHQFVYRFGEDHVHRMNIFQCNTQFTRRLLTYFSVRLGRLVRKISFCDLKLFHTSVGKCTGMFYLLSTYMWHNNHRPGAKVKYDYTCADLLGGRIVAEKCGFLTVYLRVSFDNRLMLL